MLSIQSCSLPANALLSRYCDLGAYTDCFQTEIDGQISHSAFVTAFYTTRLFKTERAILKLWLSKPSSDEEVIQLANGETDSFAAWFVEERCDNQLLLTDYQHITRSWLMVEPADNEANPTTRLYFGSAIVPQHPASDGTKSLGLGFSLLIGFHKLYSILLLYSAKARLQRSVIKT